MKTKNPILICSSFFLLTIIFTAGIFWSKQNQQSKPVAFSRPPESIGYNYILPVQNTQTTTADFIIDFIKKSGGKLPDGHLQSTLLMSKSGIKYSHVGGGGIAGIFTIKEGYAIPDYSREKIVILNFNFRIIREIDVSKYGATTAVVQDGSDLVALFAYGQVPQLLISHLDGSIQSYNILLKHQTAPIGLAVDSLGLIVKYDDGGRRVSSFGTSSIELAEPAPYIWNGKNFETNWFAPNEAARQGSAERFLNRDYLSLDKFIGSDKKGESYALVEYEQFIRTVLVDQYLWHFLSDGKAMSVAKVPLDKQFVYVDHPVTLDQNGEPVVLVAKKDRLEFWSLTPVSLSSGK